MDPIITFPPVGLCIYCGKPADAKDELSNEHIIPLGIGGRIILPKSSCKICQNATSAVELYVLRQMWGQARAVMGIKSTRRKNKPSPKFKVEVIPETSGPNIQHVEYAEVSIPPNVPIMVFGPPGILLNLEPSGNATVHALGLMVGTSPRDPVIRDKRVRVEYPFNHATLFRMFAKIAHGYAIAKLGFNGFSPLLRETIKVGSGIEPYFVGGFGGAEQPILPAINFEHDIFLDTTVINGKSYVRAIIRLFARRNFPLHQVIVGEVQNHLHAPSA